MKEARLTGGQTRLHCRALRAAMRQPPTLDVGSGLESAGDYGGFSATGAAQGRVRDRQCGGT
jgi:hypothetical protein